MARLEVHDLKTSFYTRGGITRAVDGISFDVGPGETLGIVGESGSGKSVACYSLLRLIPTPPGRIEGGRALFADEDLLQISTRELRKIRGRKISMIFQDPMTCLNPYLTIGTQLMEPLFIHFQMNARQAQQRAREALQEVGIRDVERRIKQYPHEFSGGMRQRVMIAMALITEPELLIADEPTTALDVTVQAQILDLIRNLQKKRGMSVIFITHDLGVIASMANRIAVMYAGKIVESGTASDLFYRPAHPYTRALLQSIPSTHARGEPLTTIPGIPPDLSQLGPGCAFAPRCKHARARCQNQLPPLHPTHVGSDQAAACWLSVQEQNT